MPDIQHYDIRNIDWPVSILDCKRQVDRMKPGQRLDVLVNDIDVVNTLIALLKNFTGIRIETEKKETHYILIISKYEAV